MLDVSLSIVFHPSKTILLSEKLRRVGGDPNDCVQAVLSALQSPGSIQHDDLCALLDVCTSPVRSTDLRLINAAWRCACEVFIAAGAAFTADHVCGFLRLISSVRTVTDTSQLKVPVAHICRVATNNVPLGVRCVGSLIRLQGDLTLRATHPEFRQWVATVNQTVLGACDEKPSLDAILACVTHAPHVFDFVTSSMPVLSGLLGQRLVRCLYRLLDDPTSAEEGMELWACAATRLALHPEVAGRDSVLANLTVHLLKVILVEEEIAEEDADDHGMKVVKAQIVWRVLVASSSSSWKASVISQLLKLGPHPRLHLLIDAHFHVALTAAMAPDVEDVRIVRTAEITACLAAGVVLDAEVWRASAMAYARQGDVRTVLALFSMASTNGMLTAATGGCWPNSYPHGVGHLRHIREMQSPLVQIGEQDVVALRAAVLAATPPPPRPLVLLFDATLMLCQPPQTWFEFIDRLCAAASSTSSIMDARVVVEAVSTVLFLSAFISAEELDGGVQARVEAALGALVSSVTTCEILPRLSLDGLADLTSSMEVFAKATSLDYDAVIRGSARELLVARLTGSDCAAVFHHDVHESSTPLSASLISAAATSSSSPSSTLMSIPTVLGEVMRLEETVSSVLTAGSVDALCRWLSLSHQPHQQQQQQMQQHRVAVLSALQQTRDIVDGVITKIGRAQ